MVSRDAPEPHLPIRKKRNKIDAFFTKWRHHTELRSRSRKVQEKAQNLIVTAKDLHDEVQMVTVESGKVLEEAQAVRRPATPPERESLFQRPKDAPLSGYEQQAKSYNEVVNQYRVLQLHFRNLQEKVANFKEAVRQLKAGHTPAPKMDKTEHDLESLENACGNLDAEMSLVAACVDQAKTAAT